MCGQWSRSITTGRWANAEFDAQRTIRRVELAAFLCLFKKVAGPTMVHVDHKGIIDGLWRGDMRCIGSRAKDAGLWIFIGEASHKVHQEGMLVEVEHVKPHRFKREMQQMSLFEKFITEDNEKSRRTSERGSNVGWRRYAAASSQDRNSE